MNELLSKQVYSQPPTRKSRSISRYFLGAKRSSIDNIRQDYDIHRCLISIGIFDSYELYTNVTLFRHETTCRRLIILTTNNQLIIGKYLSRQILFKLKHRFDLSQIWLTDQLSEQIVSEITSLTYYDSQRSLILGWPLADNYLVEFENQTQRNLWKERLQSKLRIYWHLNENHLEHVRIVIDQNYSQLESNQQNSTSFLIVCFLSKTIDQLYVIVFVLV